MEQLLRRQSRHAGMRPSACTMSPVHRRRRTAGTRPTSACQRRGGAGTGRSPGSHTLPSRWMAGQVDPTSLKLNCLNDTVCFGHGRHGIFMKRTLLQFRVESWIGKICTESVTDRLPMEKGRTNSKGRVPQHRQWPSRRRQRRRWRRADDGWGTWLGERRRREPSKSTDTWGAWMPINMLIDGAEA